MLNLLHSTCICSCYEVPADASVIHSYCSYSITRTYFIYLFGTLFFAIKYSTAVRVQSKCNNSYCKVLFYFVILLSIFQRAICIADKLG